MVLFDILGKRWTLRILWELRQGPLSFRALRERCDDVSPTLLSQRLKTLRNLEIVQLGDKGYSMTDHGTSLGKHMAKLDIWANDWADQLHVQKIG